MPIWISLDHTWRARRGEAAICRTDAWRASGLDDELPLNDDPYSAPIRVARPCLRLAKEIATR
jgi:hypothetical protein